ncbi:hypothetical protein [Streptomyces sp. NBC_01506]|uniref:hypothetical protein n=1 Tax=Streptomyces sp. NBC_01506 TaxID=2903887 RepID=UPI00386AAEB2
MTAERFAGATPVLVILASGIVLTVLVIGEARRVRRAEARAAERAARPHSVHVATAVQDAAAITQAAIDAASLEHHGAHDG